jgi:hypothetical protein
LAFNPFADGNLQESPIYGANPIPDYYILS